MTLKEYLQINPRMLLDNQMNVFMLTWIEKSGLTTAKEIARTTNLPISQVSTILQVLYKNSLISLDDENYSISHQGVELLNKLGFSDFLVKSILEKTSFNDEEYSIYNSLFRVYRENFLHIYLYMLFLYKNEYHRIIREYCSKIDAKNAPNDNDAETLFWTVLMHEIGHFLYTEENSNLINYYTRLYDYCAKFYCFSSEVYHIKSSDYDNSDTWRPLVIFMTNSIRNNMSKSYSFYQGKKSWEQLLSQNLNFDFSLRNKIFSPQSEFLYLISNTSDVKELSSKSNISEAQSRLILKAMREKINDILKSED